MHTSKGADWLINPDELLDRLGDIIADLDSMELHIAANHADHARSLLEQRLGKSNPLQAIDAAIEMAIDRTTHQIYALHQE